MADANITVDQDALEQLFENLDVEAVVGYAADYAAYVEYPTSYAGTKPPFTPIYEWVVRKWQDLESGLKAAGEDGADTTQEAQENVAWIVVNAIAESGTDGVFFLNRGFEAAKQAAPQFLEAYEGTDDPDAARKAIEDTLDFAFETSQDIVADEATDRGTLLQSGFVVVDQNGQEVFTKGGA
jgi:nitrogen regulatory protein PII-like uncharacterized protein